MANNNSKPQDDLSLEVFLREEKIEKKKSRESKAKRDDAKRAQDKSMLKAMNAIYTPLNNTQSLISQYNKIQSLATKKQLTELEKNNELMKLSISNTKNLYNLIEKALEKPKVTVSRNNKEMGKKQNDNFDNKAKHEQSILGHDDHILPVLTSIKSDTSQIVKLLESQIKIKKDEPKPKNDDGSWFDKLPPSAKFIPWVLPLVAAVAATKYSEVGNGVKAGLGLTKAGLTIANPILEAARAGASGAAGAAKISSSINAARGAANLANVTRSLKGPTTLGAIGKLGVGLGAGATVGRALDGDTTGATLQGISTLLPLLLSKTKYGKIATLASAGIDVGLLGRDYIKYEDKKQAALANGENVVSPLQSFKDDVNKVGSFFGFGSDDQKTNPIDPVVQNTAETNKILQDIRDGKVNVDPKPQMNSLASSAIMAGGAALLLRGGLGRIGSLGSASTGLGQRILGGISNVRSAALPAAATVGKNALGKIIPGVGVVMGAYGAYDKLQQNDYTGAAIEGASGIASLVPGIGTAIAIGLQGISATRDAIKATNAEQANNIKETNNQVNKAVVNSVDSTNQQILTSANTANNKIIDVNSTLAASIQSNTDMTNKNISDTTKSANDSIKKSSESLDNTTSLLATSLTNASNTLLGMISKFSIGGAIFEGGKALGNWAFGNAPAADSLAQGHSNLHQSRKNNMVTVYQSLLKAGMNDNQARIMTAEIGRENSFGNNLWQAHTDDKNGNMNVGMMSWQGERAIKLMSHMRKKGLLNPDGSIKRTQAAIDAQAEFIMQEMRGDYSKIGSKFLDNKNISYQDGSKILGKEYIKWAYDNPKYASGHKNRDMFYSDINSELYKRGVTGEVKKTYISKKEFDNLSKATPRPPMIASAKIQADWKKSEDDRVKKLASVQKGILAGTTVIGTAPKVQSNKSGVLANPQTKNSKDEGSNDSNSKMTNREYYELGLKSVDIAKGVDMAGLRPECRDAFYSMIGELFATKKPNRRPRVTSAFRSSSKQQALWNEELKKRNGNEQEARQNVAKPGTSKHESGLALDVDYKQGQTVKLLESSGLLTKYGFSRPLSHEPWHIEYGSGSAVSSAASALASAAGDLLDNQDFKSIGAVWDASKTLAATGLSAILSNEAMDGIREFIKGGKIDAPKDKYGKPQAAGVFSADTSDPSRTLPKDSGNGIFWDNLDQQLGDGTLKRQERNQEEYDKVKKAFAGKDGIFRQIGAKYGWLSNIFGGLFGENNSLNDLIKILIGDKNASILNNSNTDPFGLDQIGVVGGGFGGGLASSKISSDVNGNISKVEKEDIKDKIPDITDSRVSMSSSDYPISQSALEQMGAVGGGFGGSLYYDNTPSKYDQYEFDEAKYERQKIEEQRNRVEVSLPQAIQTPTAQAPAGGKSSRSGLGTGQMFVRNPDSVIMRTAMAYLRSSL